MGRELRYISNSEQDVGVALEISYRCIPDDACLLPEGPASLGKEMMGSQRHVQVKAPLIWLLLSINYYFALVTTYHGPKSLNCFI